MLIRIITVGVRMPAWVEAAVADYSARMPAEFKLEWKEIKPEPRTASGNASLWKQREAQRIRAHLPENALRIILDEQGRDLSTVQLSQRLAHWRESGRPVAILIGGADGLANELKTQADEELRLSSLTLPHMLVRVLLAEQLFRAWSILANHPYHRA
jgi:23S rRNA (pseudouridine1915-N3)-methyltransferase